MAHGIHYFPIAWPFLLLLSVLFGLTVGLVTSRILAFMSASMGVGPRTMSVLLLLSLLGSYVNIPFAYIPGRVVPSEAEIAYFGMLYVVPVTRHLPATVLAINVGGALIPIGLSIYLMAKNRLFGLSLVGVAIVAAVCHQLAQPVPHLGIALPTFVPPLVTAVVALALSKQYTAPLAYICGSLGTLIGADLLNLDKVQGLGAPIASIGGAGTFDGIYITGLLAVAYASLGRHRPPAGQGGAGAA